MSDRSLGRRLRLPEEIVERPNFSLSDADARVYMMDQDRLNQVIIGDHQNPTERVARRMWLEPRSNAVPAAERFADGPRLDARFLAPKQIAFTNDGRLFIADTGNQVIRGIDTNVPYEQSVVINLTPL